MIAKIKKIIKKLIPQPYLDTRRDLYEAKHFLGDIEEFVPVSPSYRLSEEND